MMWHTRQLGSELPPHYSAADMPLRLSFGGHDATLRWLEPQDTGRLVQLFAAHYEETAHRPGGAPGMHLTPEQAERLVSIDQERDAALGIFEEIDGELRLMGIGLFCRGDDGRSAAMSFVVHEQRRGIGIATVLLHALIAIAGERKLERLVAHVRPDNAPMIHVLLAAGATIHHARESPVIEAVLRLHRSAGDTTPHPPERTMRPATWMRSVTARAALQFERASAALQRFPTP